MPQGEHLKLQVGTGAYGTSERQHERDEDGSHSREGYPCVSHNINAGNKNDVFSMDRQSLLRSGKLQEAIEILKINARLSPQVAGAFVSLGEAYSAAGQNDLAIENYEKALKLNPKNENARKALAKLRPAK